MIKQGRDCQTEESIVARMKRSLFAWKWKWCIVYYWCFNIIMACRSSAYERPGDTAFRVDRASTAVSNRKLKYHQQYPHIVLGHSSGTNTATSSIPINSDLICFEIINVYFIQHQSDSAIASVFRRKFSFSEFNFVTQWISRIRLLATVFSGPSTAETR